MPVDRIFRIGSNYPVYEVHRVVRGHVISCVVNTTVVRPSMEVRAGHLNFYRERFSRVVDGHKHLRLTLVLRSRISRLGGGVFSGGLFGSIGGGNRGTGGVARDYFIYRGVS